MAKKHKKKKIDMQSVTLLTILVLFIGIGGYAIVQSFQSDDSKEQVKRVQINVENQPVIGDSKAPVTIVEFGDYKCPSCKNFHETVYPLLKKEYIDTGKVKMVFRNFQFLGEDSITAGMIGEAIYKQKPEAFWKYYDLIYKNQKEETTVWATPEFILPLVKKHIPEVDTNKISKEVQEKVYEQEVVKDNQYAQSLQLTGVPAVFVNGIEVNAMDYRQLKDTIEKELKNK